MSHREDARVLQEERPLLGKEQIEAVEIDLLVVHFDLGEVGVVGQVECHARCHAVLEVGAEIAGADGARVFGPGQRLTQQVGCELKVSLGGDLDSLELSGQGDPIDVVLTRQRRPVGLLIARADVPLEIHAPVLHVVPRIAQRRERNRDFRRPPDVGHRGDHLPGPVPVEIEAAA